MSSVSVKWRLCPYSEFYLVSNQGQVKNKFTGKVIKPWVKANGYISISLSLVKNGGKHFYVHRLVYESFVGEIPKGLVINHINGIKDDNNLSNLELTTYKGNIRHAIKIGLMADQIGENNHASKWADKDVLKIKQMAQRMSNIEVARELGISHKTVSRFVTGKAFSHVAPELTKSPYDCIRGYSKPEALRIIANSRSIGIMGVDIRSRLGIGEQVFKKYTNELIRKGVLKRNGRAHLDLMEV